MSHASRARAPTTSACSILDGVLARELVVADHVSAELLGPGDLVRPVAGRQPRRACCPSTRVWSVLSPLTVAVLDRRFAAEVARYPEITAALFDRLSERSLRLATTQAISQLTRVDRRLKALFWHLAERWGRVSGDGVDRPARAHPPDPRPARRRAPADRLDRAVASSPSARS